MGESIDSRLESVRKEISELKLVIATNREKVKDKSLSECAESISKIDVRKLLVRRTLKGHIFKIYSFNWGKDSQHLVSVGQDGKLIAWDALSALKSSALTLRSSWVITCAYSPSLNFAAAGGLDNICSIYSLVDRDDKKPLVKELMGHNACISSLRFISEEKLLSSSGDSSCFLWDIEKGKIIGKYEHHEKDIMAISLNPTDSSTFVSISLDRTAKLWDVKSFKLIATFNHHDSDPTCVDFFPNGYAFATGAEDAIVKLFDIRSQSELIKFSKETVSSPATSLSFSIGGKYLFTGRDDFKINVWDTLKGELLDSLENESRVSCLATSPNGLALCSGGWDSYLRLWA